MALLESLNVVQEHQNFTDIVNKAYRETQPTMDSSINFSRSSLNVDSMFKYASERIKS